MSYVDQWKALSSRIRGLVEAGHLHASYLKVDQNSDPGGRQLGEQAKQTLNTLSGFRTDFHSSLPPSAVDVIDAFCSKAGPACNAASDGGRVLWMALVCLAAFETEMSFLLADAQQSIRTYSERAFAHLQRSIAADEEIQQKWQKAFNTEGEVACEKLGAAHLLAHGIWAFKVHSTGARTDLVFQEPVRDLAAIERYSTGLVLTEWKKVKVDSEAAKLFKEAIAQAELYAHGPLATTELRSYRYAVVVSEQQVTTPVDFQVKEVIYRHINIAVNPLTPSKESKRSSSKQAQS